jgi:hypothetical protein
MFAPGRFFRVERAAFDFDFEVIFDLVRVALRPRSEIFIDILVPICYRYSSSVRAFVPEGTPATR